MSERIYLRACIIDGPRDADGRLAWGFSGVVLPDGRIITAGHPSNPERPSLCTFSSEAALERLHPGATLRLFPDADAVVNEVDEGL